MEMTRALKGNKLTSLAALIGALPDCEPASAAAAAVAADSKTNETGRKTVRDLNDQMKEILLRNGDSRESTKTNRRRLCTSIANDLDHLGFKTLDIRNLKLKHVKTLIASWQSRDLSPGTQKNYMATLRWLCEKIGKPNLIARANDTHGIPDRSYLADVSKGQDVIPARLTRIAKKKYSVSVAPAISVADHMAAAGGIEDATADTDTATA